MSEYMQGFIDKDRLCDEVVCGDCPLCSNNTGENMSCEAFCVNRPDQAESILRKWVAEHPVKRNPTWREWHKRNTPNAARVLAPCNFGPCPRNICTCSSCLDDPIPDDIMKKQHFDQIEE